MDISLKPASDVPLFRQLHDHVVTLIARGDLQPGDRLVSVRALAKELKVNPATVVKAYDLLKEEGLLSSQERGGSVVMSPDKRGVMTPHEVLRPQIALLLAAGCSVVDIHRAVDHVAAELGAQEVQP